ncbi:solute carrier family 35 member F6-like [Uloborus diversus]|uniref:solute carrier family 35 member F6-like n=1 Tax=Uloborus diversus TaxID=327109 RepID=UPI002409E4D7|nr:solute carrier family 35 member F6-like [Uloborus diversus]
MAWTKYQKLLALLMVITGSINTLATKWADMLSSTNSVGEWKPFNHPFLQASGMFLGELSCLLVFKLMVCWSKRKALHNEYTEIGASKFNPVIFLAPALCDMTATSLMYVGLNLTYASSFQMLRGAIIVFTGLLSVAFLDRQLKKLEWSGIFVVILGLLCVGLSDVIYPSKTNDYSPNSIITGDLLIIMAQIIGATQMVVEEKFVSKYNVPPLQGVGWEGFFGFTILTILLIPMYYIKVGHSIFDNPHGSMEDAIDGLIQMRNSWQVSTAVAGTIISIAFFNFAGLSVTKEMSATTRMVLDSVRTFVVWIFSLAIQWQTFSWLQLLGFIILLAGMCLYNDVILRPLYEKLRDKYRQRFRKNEYEPLLRNTDEESESPRVKTGSINA